MEVATTYESPRNYHWFPELVRYQEHYVSITYLDLTVDKCDAAFFAECRKWRAYNARVWHEVDKVLVFIFSPDPVTLPSAEELARLAGSDGVIETFRMVVSDQERPRAGWGRRHRALLPA
jgi:hypothetical protein